MPIETDKPQEEALDEAHKILGRAFDAWIIIGRFSREDSSKTLDSVRHRRRGAFTDCRGMIEVMRDAMKRETENSDIPE